MKKLTKVKIVIGTTVTVAIGGILAYYYYKDGGWKYKIKSKKASKLIDSAEDDLFNIKTCNDVLKMKYDQIKDTNDIEKISEFGDIRSGAESNMDKTESVIKTIVRVSDSGSYSYWNSGLLNRTIQEYSKAMKLKKDSFENIRRLGKESN